MEVEDLPDDYLGYETGIAKLVKMKIKGIKETVNLKYNKYGGKHTRQFELRINIGEREYAYSDGDYQIYIDESRTSEVLKQLHEVLEIPKHQTVQMIYLLFCGMFSQGQGRHPYSYGDHFDDIEPREGNESGIKPVDGTSPLIS